MKLTEKGRDILEIQREYYEEIPGKIAILYKKRYDVTIVPWYFMRTALDKFVMDTYNDAVPWREKILAPAKWHLNSLQLTAINKRMLSYRDPSIFITDYARSCRLRSERLDQEMVDKIRKNNGTTNKQKGV